jgi:hypothetical protein
MVVLGGIAVFGIAMNLRQFGRGEGFDTQAIASCNERFARARTGAESALVTRQIPITSHSQATVAVSCGTLRSAGKLR